MEQRIDAIEVSDQEAAAIAATIDRLKAAEPDLTAEALLARMAHKVVRAWADQFTEQATTQQLRLIEEKLRDVPPADRTVVVAQVVDALEAATPKPSETVNP